MKKLLLSLVVLLATLGAWAQKFNVTETKYKSVDLNSKTEATYIAIKNLSATNHYVGNTGAVPYSKPSFSNDAVFIWEPAGEGQFFLKKLDGTYMQTSSPKDFGTVDNAAKFTTTNPTSTGSGSTKFNGDGDSQAYIDGNDDANLVRFVNVKDSKWINVQNGDGGTPTYNTGLGGWTIHHVYQVEAEEVKEVNIVYNFQYEGRDVATQSTNVWDGDDYPEVTCVFPYGFTAAKPEGKVNAEEAVDGKITKIIELTKTKELPFVAAADFNSIEHWYYISIKEMPVYYKEGQTAIELSAGDIPVDNKDAYTWAFVGNPFDGYELYNYVTGSTKILSSSTTMSGDNGNGVTPIMTGKPVPAGNNTHWFATNSPYYTNGFYLAQQGFDSNKMNSRADIVKDKNILSYCTGGVDNGSTFTVKERNFAITADLEELVAKASAINYGTTVGYYTQASVEVLKAAIDEANAAIGGEPTQDEVNALELEITNAMAALKIVLPEEGKFYNIVSANTSYAAGKQIYVSDDAGLKFDTPTGKNIGNVFKFVPVEGQEDQFYVCNVERGLYISTNKGHGGGQQKAEFGVIDLANPITIANMGSKDIVKLTPVGGAMIHAQKDYSVVVGWNADDYTSASAWRIVEVEDMTTQLHTLKVGELGYSTIYLAYDAAIPEDPAFEGDNGVYVAEQVNAEGTAMNLKKIEGVLPANTGAIVKAPQGEYEFAYSATAGTETSMLKGSTSDKNIVATANKNYYILSHEEGEVAFFKTTTSVLELDGGYANIFFNHAFKAYLPIEQGSAARSLVFNFGGETGIHDIESGDLNGGNAEIYDLSGRRVQKAQKGLYIINGKKVVR